MLGIEKSRLIAAFLMYSTLLRKSV